MKSSARPKTDPQRPLVKIEDAAPKQIEIRHPDNLGIVSGIKYIEYRLEIAVNDYVLLFILNAVSL
jgi:hypothetical protein